MTPFSGTLLAPSVRRRARKKKRKRRKRSTKKTREKSRTARRPLLPRGSRPPLGGCGPILGAGAALSWSVDPCSHGAPSVSPGTAARTQTPPPTAAREDGMTVIEARCEGTSTSKARGLWNGFCAGTSGVVNQESGPAFQSPMPASPPYLPPSLAVAQVQLLVLFHKDSFVLINLTIV